MYVLLCMYAAAPLSCLSALAYVCASLTLTLGPAAIEMRSRNKLSARAVAKIICVGSAHQFGPGRPSTHLSRANR